MDENYAFFDLHGVDWQARRTLAPHPDDTMSDANLFTLLQQMTQPVVLLTSKLTGSGAEIFTMRCVSCHKSL